MADSWEDWEDAEPVVPGAPAADKEDPAKSRFADEDQGEEDEPKWKANVPAPQQVGAGRGCGGLQGAVEAPAGGSQAVCWRWRR